MCLVYKVEALLYNIILFSIAVGSHLNLIYDFLLKVLVVTWKTEMCCSWIIFISLGFLSLYVVGQEKCQQKVYNINIKYFICNNIFLRIAGVWPGLVGWERWCLCPALMLTTC